MTLPENTKMTSYSSSSPLPSPSGPVTLRWTPGLRMTDVVVTGLSRLGVLSRCLTLQLWLFRSQTLTCTPVFHLKKCLLLLFVLVVPHLLCPSCYFWKFPGPFLMTFAVQSELLCLPPLLLSTLPVSPFLLLLIVINVMQLLLHQCLFWKVQLRIHRLLPSLTMPVIYQLSRLSRLSTSLSPFRPRLKSHPHSPRHSSSQNTAFLKRTPHPQLPSFLLLLLLLSCAPNNVEAQKPVVKLRGAGATFPTQVYESWKPLFRAYRQRAVTIEPSYSPVGSGEGKKAIIKRQDVEYAGSDSLLSQAEMDANPDLRMFPTMAGAVVMAYNLPRCNPLNLTRDAIVGIYNGTVTQWDDVEIASANPGCLMTNRTIRVIARADKSGSTDLFTEALSSFSEPWKSTYGSFSTGVDPTTEEAISWPRGVVTMFGTGTRGMVGLILSIRYSIGYLSQAEADSSVQLAHVENARGQLVSPGEASVQAAMEDQARSSSSLTVFLSDSQVEGAYPIAGYTYLIVYMTSMTNCLSARELVRYVLWFMEEEEPREDCRKEDMVPLSPTVVARVKEQVLQRMTCGGRSMWEAAMADLEAESVPPKEWLVPVAVTVPLGLLLLGALAGYILYQRIKINRMIDSDEWNIPIEDILFFMDDKVHSGGRSKLLGPCARSIKSLRSVEGLAEGAELLSQILQWPGRWGAHVVGIRLLEVKQLAAVSRPLKKCMLWMRDCLIHTNVVRFYGLTEVEGQRYAIGEYCSKGAMTDVLQNEKFNLTDDFKFSLALDVCSGMAFLHAHGLVHGHLSSACCFIDARWTVKVGDWELCRMLQVLDDKRSPLPSLRGTAEDLELGSHARALRDFWVAPELLRAEFTLTPTQAMDVYSFAIVLQEIFTREDPYAEHADTMSPDELKMAIVNNNLRPCHSEDIPVSARQVMETGWCDNPVSRPSFDQLSKMLRRGRGSRKSVLDAMMEAMEEYTAHLEERVEERNQEVEAARASLEGLLRHLVPGPFVDSVLNRRPLPPVSTATAGLLALELSDLPQLTPEATSEVMGKYLTSLHASIDVIVQSADACRVTLTSNALFFALDLDPNISRKARAEHLAHLALNIMATVAKTTRPSEITQCPKVRVCCHQGEVVVGVVGSNCPRLVLLGQSVELTQQLLLHSKQPGVRVSGTVHRYLSPSTFHSQPAADLVVQKERLSTFWLTGREGEEVTPGAGGEPSEDSGVESEERRRPDSAHSHPTIDDVGRGSWGSLYPPGDAASLSRPGYPHPLGVLQQGAPERGLPRGGSGYPPYPSPYPPSRRQSFHVMRGYPGQDDQGYVQDVGRFWPCGWDPHHPEMAPRDHVCCCHGNGRLYLLQADPGALRYHRNSVPFLHHEPHPEYGNMSHPSSAPPTDHPTRDWGEGEMRDWGSGRHPDDSAVDRGNSQDQDADPGANDKSDFAQAPPPAPPLPVNHHRRFVTSERRHGGSRRSEKLRHRGSDVMSRKRADSKEEEVQEEGSVSGPQAVTRRPSKSAWSDDGQVSIKSEVEPKDLTVSNSSQNGEEIPKEPSCQLESWEVYPILGMLQAQSKERNAAEEGSIPVDKDRAQVSKKKGKRRSKSRDCIPSQAHLTSLTEDRSHGVRTKESSQGHDVRDKSGGVTVTHAAIVHATSADDVLNRHRKKKNVSDVDFSFDAEAKTVTSSKSMNEQHVLRTTETHIENEHEPLHSSAEVQEPSLPAESQFSQDVKLEKKRKRKPSRQSPTQSETSIATRRETIVPLPEVDLP